MASFVPIDIDDDDDDDDAGDDDDGKDTEEEEEEDAGRIRGSNDNSNADNAFTGAQ